MDRRRHGGRGAAAGVDVDPRVQSAVQRHVPGRHPARLRDARQAEEGHHVLRAVRPGLGDPRVPRSAAPGVPRPHVHVRRPPARGAQRPPLPAGLHRQVLRPLRGAGVGGRAPRAGPRDRGLHVRLHRHAHLPAEEGDGERGPGAGLRARRPPARRDPGPGEGPGEERRRALDERGLRCLRRPLRRARGRGPGLPRARRADPR
jgi:hypothetical protein